MEPIVKSKYEIYLGSEQFADLRQKVLRRDHNKCRACGSTENLQVHHLSYRNIYHEELDDLVCLCRNCHAAFHAVNELQKFYDELHENRAKREAEERQRQFENDRERIESLELEIMEEIKEEYASQDYAKNGDLNMCEWYVLNPIIAAKCAEKGHDGWFSKKIELRNWFLYRRYELLLRCIESGRSLDVVIKNTKFNPDWLAKNYRKDKLEAKLQEEKILYEIKEVTE